MAEQYENENNLNLERTEENVNKAEGPAEQGIERVVGPAALDFFEERVDYSAVTFSDESSDMDDAEGAAGYVVVVPPQQFSPQQFARQQFACQQSTSQFVPQQSVPQQSVTQQSAPQQSASQQFIPQPSTSRQFTFHQFAPRQCNCPCCAVRRVRDIGVEIAGPSATVRSLEELALVQAAAEEDRLALQEALSLERAFFSDGILNREQFRELALDISHFLNRIFQHNRFLDFAFPKKPKTAEARSKALKKTKLAEATETDRNDICVVCMEHYIPGESLRFLRCSHYYHRECVDKWLDEISYCPLCRRDIADN